MPEAGTLPLAKSYAANVVLVVLTLFPGLINTSAIALATRSAASRSPPGCSSTAR
jgi:hypothetical protein